MIVFLVLFIYRLCSVK